MSRYRRIEVRMWGDQKFRNLDSATQLLWCYLLSGPETTHLPGVLTIGEMGLAEAMGWDLRLTRQCLTSLVDSGMVLVDKFARLIFLPNAPRHNPPFSGKNVKGWASAIHDLPESTLTATITSVITEALGEIDANPEDGAKPTTYKALFKKALSEKQHRSSIDAASKQHRTCIDVQDQDQDKEEEKKEVENPAAPAAPPPPLVLIPEDPQEKKPSEREIASTVAAVIEHYVHGGPDPKGYHPKAKPGHDARLMVRERVMEGWTLEELKTAIDVIHRNPFYCGVNDRDRKYQDLEHALGDSDKVTRHNEWHVDHPPKPPPLTEAQSVARDYGLTLDVAVAERWWEECGGRLPAFRDRLVALTVGQEGAPQ